MRKIIEAYLSYAEYLKQNQNTEEINKQVSVFASFGAMILAIVAFITLSIVRPFSLINILAGICVINVVFNTFYAEKNFGHKMKTWVDIYCVGFYMLIMPILWFGTGGFEGVGGVWMIFAAVYCIFGVNGRIQRTMLNLFATEVLAIMIWNIIHPELVAEFSIGRKYVIGIVSIVGVGMYIQIIQYMQYAEFVKDRKKLEELQEDITAHYEESVAVNDELFDTAQKLELANKTQRSFTASMNHELRAPLNGIEGCLQILMMDESISTEAKETIKNALTASKTINQTVNDLLDFAKLEEGKFEIVKKQFDLRDIIDNLSTIFRPQANAKNLKFYIHIPVDARVSIVADGVRIQQVMTNLISNGIKYTREGSVVMTITTERGHLLFDVKDTGQGMSEESLKVLFDPFTRFNQEENVHIQGTGLGMNIVSNMIKQMKGSISVESELNVGTVFHVDIPIMFYDSNIVYSTPRDTENMQKQVKNLEDVSVLCVDDTEINRTVFKGLLKKTGATVTTADCGSKAVKLCQENTYDIIFLDHQMPEMDGIETLQGIRNIIGGKYANVPIIMFTGNAGEEYRKLYEENGADGYLLKPIMYDELLECFELIAKK